MAKRHVLSRTIAITRQWMPAYDTPLRLVRNRAIPSAHWVHSPLYDLFFFATPWWLPACLLMYLGARSLALGAAVFFIAYHVFLRLPHFVATLRTTYLNPDNRAYYREHWVTYFFMPMLILSAYGAGTGVPLDSPLKKILITVSTCWGLQHISFQNFGILGVYHGRSGVPASEPTRALEKAVFLLLFVAAAFEGVLRLWLDGTPAGDTVTDLARITRIAPLIATGAYLVRVALLRNREAVSIPQVLFFMTAVVSTIYWPIYNSFGGPEQGSRIFFYVFNGHHCLCYLGLTYLMDRNQKSQRTAAQTANGRTSPFLGFLWPMVTVSMALMATGILAVGPSLQTVRGMDLFTALGVLDGFFVTHYFLESNHWKFSRAHLRKTILPLLRRPQRG